MAHKKAGGSTRNGRKSNPNMLGIKKSGGQHVIAGNIIARQRGTSYHPGVNVGMGRDHTIYATVEGRVSFVVKGRNKRKYINVVPLNEENTKEEAA